jgi:cytochrome c-type biogenesis protein CcmE
VASVVSTTRRSPLSGGNLKFVIAGGVIALAVAYLVTMGLQGTTEYFLTVSELQARGPSAQNQLLRVSGTLVPGSLTRESDGLGVHFLIADAGAASPLTVTYKGGQVPDTMSDTSANNIEIVAEGKLNATGSFAATDVLAKCPSRLDDAGPTERDYATGA